MNEKIRLSKSCIGLEEQAATARVLDGEYLGMGEETRLFEEEVRAFIGGNREVVAVNTGTSALHMTVACLDIGPGDEVLVPTMTYVACFQAVSATGAIPVACDVLEDSVCLDPRDAERRITPRTRAIMPVHYAAGFDGLDAVYEVAARHHLRVVEDAAHAFGGLSRGAPVGQKGDVVCFSFDGIKNITAGEGGAIVTGDAALARRLRDARLLGVERDTDARYRQARSWDFDVKHQGFRYHMSNLFAAIGRVQLKKLARFAAARQSLARSYDERLRGLPHVALLKTGRPDTVPHIYPVRVLDGRRDAVRRIFEERNIEWGFHYKPNHQLSLYRPHGAPLSVGERLGEELLTIPLHPDLTPEMQDAVIKAVTDAVEANC